jgi:hypothetical protein
MDRTTATKPELSPAFSSALWGGFTQHKAERNWNFGSAFPSQSSGSCACACPLFVLRYASCEADRTWFFGHAVPSEKAGFSAPARRHDGRRTQTGGVEAYDWLKNALASSSLFRGHFPRWRQLRPSCSVLLLP